EVEVGQALDELGLWELVDVLLEREIDELSPVGDEALLLDRPDVLSRHPLPQPRLDVGVLEVKEVPRIVPGEPRLLDRLAVAANLLVGLEDEEILVTQEGRGGEAADA